MRQLLLWLILLAGLIERVPAREAVSGTPHPRVLVSTDIGGTDPDDFQSMVHLLVYADRFDLEGLVHSPYGPGRSSHILQVIDLYGQDYPSLKSYSDRYPSPEALRKMTRQGALEDPGLAGYGRPTEGSRQIVDCARRPDPRPLYVLVWGGIEDLAQALHDAPDILPRLRVFFIGGPNKMWSVNAYNYIEENHPGLWMVESNSTYRGWFVGGDQSGDLGNSSFVAAHVAGKGALGTFFAGLLQGTIKMGDSPSVGFLLQGNPEDPSAAGGWGGRYVPVWEGRKTVFSRTPSESDQAEAFGVVEFALPVPEGMGPRHAARAIFDHRIPCPAEQDGRMLRFRFSPRDAKEWSYVIRSDFPELDGRTGRFRAVAPSPEKTGRASRSHPRWWTDCQDPSLAEGIHAGAGTVSRFREPYLRDFARRMLRCQAPFRPRETP